LSLVVELVVESRVADIDEENESFVVVNHHVLLNDSSLDPCCEYCSRDCCGVCDFLSLVVVLVIGYCVADIVVNHYVLLNESSLDSLL